MIQCVLVYFSAVIEHTKQVIYLEDDDVAAVRDGHLDIHRITMNDSNVRELITLKMEIEQIMKGISCVYILAVLLLRIVHTYRIFNHLIDNRHDSYYY